MASTVLSQNDISNGRRNILQSLPNPTPYAIPTTYTRPSDWTALPTVGSTYYATGIYAVYNQDSNFVAMNCTVDGSTVAANGYINNGTNGVSGNFFQPFAAGIGYVPGFLVGMTLSGSGVPVNTVITSASTAVFTSTVSGTLLTVTSVTSGTLAVGMVISMGANTKWISSFGTGSGGVGTYNLSASSAGTSATNGYLFVTNNASSATSSTITGVNPYQVDWGDGTVDTVASGVQAQHNYVYSSVGGVVCSRGYKTAAVTVTAPTSGTTLTTANFNVKYTASTGQGAINTYTSKWLDMRINCSMIGTGSVNFTLAGANAPLNMLEQVQIDIIGYLYSVPQTLDSKFSGLKSFQSLILNSNIIVSSYTSTFANTALVSAPSLSTTNTSSATSTNAMFQACTNLTYCPPYNLSATTTTASMFLGCSELQSSPAFTTTTSLTTVSGMFQNCTSLRSVALFNTSNVSTFTSMFNGCSSLRIEGVPLFNTSAGTQFATMFNACTSLTTIPLIDTRLATNLSGLVSSCSALTSFPLLNTANTTNMTSMFNGCTALTTIPLLNTTKITSGSLMFGSTTSLITIPLIDTSNVTDMSSMFLSSGIQDVPLLNTINVTTMASMFQSCSKLDTTPLFNTSNVNTMASMFQSCTSLNTVPLYDTSKVTSMGSMFASSKVQSVPNFNTSNTTSFNSMFSAASQLATAPTFTDTSKITDVNNMFVSCYRLNSIPSYNLANCTTFISMCNTANNLVSFGCINVGSQATANFNGMFTGCTSLNNVANINAGNITVLANTITFPSLTSFASTSNVTNLKFTTSFASDNMGKTELENVFANSLFNNTTVQTITITNNPGADTANAKTSGTTAGSNVITMANTVGVIAGSTFIYGTGINTGIPVTFNDAANTVVYTNGGGLNGLVNDDNILFTSIVTGAPGFVVGTRYWVVNRTGTTFQVSTTQGGAVFDIVSNGTGVMSIGGATISNKVLTVNANANVIINGVAGITNAAASLTARNLNTNYAVTKYWTVTG